jgi:hypothetical protein
MALKTPTMTKNDDDSRILVVCPTRKTRISLTAGSGFLLQSEFQTVTEIWIYRIVVAISLWPAIFCTWGSGSGASMP